MVRFGPPCALYCLLLHSATPFMDLNLRRYLHEVAAALIERGRRMSAFPPLRPTIQFETNRYLSSIGKT
jgi:hypothetical protein